MAKKGSSYHWNKPCLSLPFTLTQSLGCNCISKTSEKNNLVYTSAVLLKTSVRGSQTVRLMSGLFFCIDLDLPWTDWPSYLDLSQSWAYRNNE